MAIKDWHGGQLIVVWIGGIVAWYTVALLVAVTWGELPLDPDFSLPFVAGVTWLLSMPAMIIALVIATVRWFRVEQRIEHLRTRDLMLAWAAAAAVIAPISILLASEVLEGWGALTAMVGLLTMLGVMWRWLGRRPRGDEDDAVG